MANADLVPTTLQGIAQPAFAAAADGRLLAGNDAGLALLSVDRGGDLDTAWRACLGAEGAVCWREGIAAAAPFGDGLRALKALGRWVYRAAPALAGGLWLVTLARETLDDGLDGQLIRMSLHAAVRAGRMGLWEWSPQTDDSLWSPELYDVYRLPRGSGVEPGSRFLRMLHPDDVAKVDAAVAAAGAKGGIDPFVFRLYTGDGELRWFMTSAQAAPDAGKPFSRLVGVNIDVTDTVQAEERLEAARLERARQQQIMQAVMEHAPVGIAVALRGEEALAYVSRFGTDMIGATPALGLRWEAWQLCHPDSKAAARREDLPLARACEGQVVSNEEWLLRTADGMLVPISCSAGPIHDEAGHVVGGTLVWYDVTPFKEAQRQRELLLAAVSHELRTPLSAIHGWAEVLRRSPGAELRERGLSAITRNVQTQARLVDDLLDAARIAAGKLALTLAPECLVRIARSAVDSVMPAAEAAQVTLQMDVADADLPVMADELRLRQALCNLLANAVKFSRPGGLVEVRLGVDGDWAQIEVADHGIGMAAEQLDRVFEQFWQGGGAGARQDGLGLGLSIARHILRGHGGRLQAHSPGVGLGSTFSLRLPLNRP